MGAAGAVIIEHPYIVECTGHFEGDMDSIMGLSKKLVLRLIDELKD